MTYSLKPPMSYSASSPRAAARFPWGLTAGTLVWLAAAVLGAVAAILSPVVFDAHGARENPLAWLAFGLVVSFWAVCLISPAVAWALWRLGQGQRAWAFMAAPLAWGALALAVLQFLPVR